MTMRNEATPKTFADAQTASSFTEWLRDAAGPLWKDATEHRFVVDVANDRLLEAVFRRYLVQEYAFVDASATVLGFTIAKAPSMAEKAHLAKALTGLTTDQEAFFQNAFESLGMAEDAWRSPPAAETENFEDFVVRTAATGAYEEPLTTMLGAEWMYLTWCSNASRSPATHPLIRAWVDLHVTREFSDGVAWLRAELDAIGPRLAPEKQRRLARIFARTLQHEIAFHEVPYRDERAGR